MVIP
jgi:hypothetical protein